MTTKPSSATWADEPYALLTTPSAQMDVSTEKSHAAVHCATEMALAHNGLIRGLNAVVQQAPHIPSSNQPRYDENDVKDLLYYVQSWVKMVEHHHDTEETVMFPAWEKMLDQPGLMAGSAHQHEEFHGGMIALRDHAVKYHASPAEWRWTAMKEIIDGFAAPLVKHLNEEVKVILGMRRFDSDKVLKAFKVGEDHAKASGKISFLYDIFPCVLGCCDKTFEGGNNFPPLPGVINYAIKYWFARSRAGAWRFSPCDFFGQPRPLPMLPENRAERD